MLCNQLLSAYWEPQKLNSRKCYKDIQLSEHNQCRSRVNQTLHSAMAHWQRNHAAITDYPIWNEWTTIREQHVQHIHCDLGNGFCCYVLDSLSHPHMSSRKSACVPKCLCMCALYGHVLLQIHKFNSLDSTTIQELKTLTISFGFKHSQSIHQDINKYNTSNVSSWKHFAFPQ